MQDEERTKGKEQERALEKSSIGKTTAGADGVHYREAARTAEKAAGQKDIRAKDIFGNRELCAQFLRDYAGIPLLEHVQPQDIEEAQLRYHFFDEAELNSDNVKRIRITDERIAADLPVVYVVALIEHKSYVDYDVAMQLLRYMVCIWYDWAKQGKRLSEHRRKDFKYPPVIPIVYYEGNKEWTAELRLKDRILLSELFGDFIPDFTYRIVENRKYTQDELLLKADEMSLLMLLNQIQTAEDIPVLKKIPSERLNAIIRNSSDAVLNEILKAVQGLCRQLNLTEKETAEYTQKVKERNMGYLWENAEKMDIQEERRLRAEAQEQLAEAQGRLAEAERKLAETEEVLKERNMGYLWENAEKMDIQEERRLRAEAQEQLAEAQRKLAEEQREFAKMIALLSQMGMDEQTVREKLREMEMTAEESSDSVGR